MLTHPGGTGTAGGACRCYLWQLPRLGPEEEIVLWVALPSDAGEGQMRALLICLEGGEPAGGHFKR